MKKYISFLLTAAMVFSLSSCAPKAPEAGTPDAKYIFFFIGDGMGAPHVAATEAYLSAKDGQFGGGQVGFANFPVLGMITTYSASNNITDSAAGGTALASGFKATNGQLGLTPEGTEVNSIACTLQNDFGYNVGIFSSVPVNHATPSAYYAHNKDRHDYYNITKQIPEAGYKFYGGSGILQFDGPNHDKDSEKMLAESGYSVAFGQREFEEAVSSGAERIVMLANPVEEHRTSVANYAAETDSLVALSQMMKDCISFLGDKKPFFIMCEGGEIDWFAHGHKALPMIDAILKMDDAVSVAYEFYLAHPDETIIIVTADHETGGLTIGNGGYMYHIEELDKQNNTAEGVWNLSSEQENELNARAGLGWTSYDHTGAPVPVYAIGRGAEKFAGRYDNTDIVKKLLNISE